MSFTTTFARKTHRDAFAKTRPGTGDDSDLAGEPHGRLIAAA